MHQNIDGIIKINQAIERIAGGVFQAVFMANFVSKRGVMFGVVGQFTELL